MTSLYAPFRQFMLATGPVSFIVEYAGLKLVFGGDTSPNKWFVKYATGADFVIHEAFANPNLYTTLMSQPPQLSWRMWHRRDI